MLNFKEERQLKMLQEKQKAEAPLSDKHLQEIDERITQIYDKAPELMSTTTRMWRDVTDSLQQLAHDNDLLVREVRRLRSAVEACHTQHPASTEQP